jgi:Tol biopolymer transport system component
MSLSPGTRLGPYEVVSLLGVGGMGEVYRAKDTKLNRDVALKVLPDLLAGDPDRLARFRREAQVLASLNHPNIGHIYGFEDTGATQALVLELVEGPTLGDRIAQGPIPLAEALQIARQIADALEAAHEQGIIHRDLKPANIKLKGAWGPTPTRHQDGRLEPTLSASDVTVKVLDFGLAKAVEGDGSQDTSPYLANSPTLTARATQMGMIIGTAAYMPPEQARGRAVDRRADIWAFGVVLFEMLTGRRAFGGDEVTDVLAAVIKDDLRWADLPADVPASVRRVLHRCLEKDPKRRLSAIGDARFDLVDTGDDSPAGTTASVTSRLAWLKLLAAGLAGVVITAVAMYAWLKPSAPATPRRLSIVAPEGAGIYPDARESAISPDGRMVAFVTGDSLAVTGSATGLPSKLWIRSLDTPSPQQIQGVVIPHLPFWSPDSRRLGFFDDGKIKTVAATGGRIDVVCPAADGRGASWSQAGVIVFAPASAGALMRVPDTGGQPVPATSLDTARKETGHRFPFFLPDGRHFLFIGLPAHEGLFDVSIGTLDNSERMHLTTSESAATYVEPGWLLFSRKGLVAAQPFDAKALRLAGDAVTLDDGPGDIGSQYSGGPAASAVSNALVYLNDPFSSTRLAWVDLSGRETDRVEAPEARYPEVRLAPDQQHAALVRMTSASASSIWTLDFARHGVQRIADAPGINYQVAWSPDGRRIAFTNDGSGTETIFVRDADAAAPVTMLFSSPALFKKVNSWAPSGPVLFAQLSPETQSDLMVVPTSGQANAAPYIHDSFNETLGRFSPDGRWVVYVSDESGHNDVYVRSFPVPDHKYRVTTDGAGWATWKRDGTGLLTVGNDNRQLKLAEVRLGADLSIGVPRIVGALPTGTIGFDAAGDLQHLLVSVPAPGSAGLSLTVVTDWRSALVKR